MSTFIKLLPLEMADIKTYSEPHQKITPNDNIVGDMSDDLKKLLTITILSGRKFAEMQVERKFGNLENDENWEGKFREAQEKTELLTKIFWVAVRDEFSMWDKGSIGVRKGFKVVWLDESSGSFMDFLNNLLEGN